MYFLFELITSTGTKKASTGKALPSPVTVAHVMQSHTFINEEREKDMYYVIASPHDSLVLSVYASADDMSGLCYQWQKDGVELSGATSSTYTVEDVTGSSNYFCEVTDKYGNSVYAYACVRVDNNLTVYINELTLHRWTKRSFTQNFSVVIMTIKRGRRRMRQLHLPNLGRIMLDAEIRC